MLDVYPHHGIEYWVELDGEVSERVIEGTKYMGGYYPDWKMLCLIPMAMTDGRLIGSQYFKRRKGHWWSANEYRNEYLCRATDVVDIQLSEGEARLVSDALRLLDKHVIHHGWYERNMFGLGC